jgi:CheY-like chemotaxis protein
MSSPDAVTVLIVDDDAIVLEIYRLALERAGYGVLVAADGEAGLRTASSAKPDFIFLDIRMPRMDGIETLRRVVADPLTRDIPVVMLSNYDEPALITETLGLGAKEYLTKVAVDPRDLAVVVARWVAQASSRSTRPMSP